MQCLAKAFSTVSGIDIPGKGPFHIQDIIPLLQNKFCITEFRSKSVDPDCPCDDAFISEVSKGQTGVLAKFTYKPDVLERTANMFESVFPYHSKTIIDNKIVYVVDTGIEITIENRFLMHAVPIIQGTCLDNGPFQLFWRLDKRPQVVV